MRFCTLLNIFHYRSSDLTNNHDWEPTPILSKLGDVGQDGGCPGFIVGA